MKKLLSLIALTALLSACGSEPEAVTDIPVTDTLDTDMGVPADWGEDKPTEIVGNMPAINWFYVLEGEEQGWLSYREPCTQGYNSFSIEELGEGYYTVMWNDGSMVDEFVIDKMEEKDGGYEFQLSGPSNSSPTYFLKRIDEYGLWNVQVDGRTFFLLEEDHISDMEVIACSDRGLIMSELPQSWTDLWEEEGEWVIYNECRYGTGGIYIDEKGQWVELSGGGNADSYDIINMYKKHNDIYFDYVYWQDTVSMYMQNPYENIVVNFGENTKRVADKNVDKVKTVNEAPCDEDEEPPY